MTAQHRLHLYWRIRRTLLSIICYFQHGRLSVTIITIIITISATPSFITFLLSPATLPTFPYCNLTPLPLVLHFLQHVQTMIHNGCYFPVRLSICTITDANVLAFSWNQTRSAGGSYENFLDVPSFFSLPVPCDNQNTGAASKAAHPLTELLSAGRSVDASCDFPRCWCFHCVGSNERLCWSSYTSCVCNNHTCIFTLFSVCFFFPGCEKDRDFMGVSKCPLPSTPPPSFSQNNRMNTRIWNEGSGLKCMQVCACEEP